MTQIKRTNRTLLKTSLNREFIAKSRIPRRWCVGRRQWTNCHRRSRALILTRLDDIVNSGNYA